MSEHRPVVSSPASDRAEHVSHGRKARFKIVWLALCAVVGLVCLVAALVLPSTTPDSARGFVTGVPIGIFAMMALLGVLVWRDRRGHESATARGTTGRSDERDYEIGRRAWQPAGIVG